MGFWHTAAVGGGIAAVGAAPLLLARAQALGIEGRAARWGGWLALPVAMALLAPVAGVEIGVAWVLAALPLPAWGWIWWHRERWPGRGDRGEAVSATDLSSGPRQRGRGGRAALRIAIALPLAGGASLLAAIALARPVGNVGSATLTALGLLVVLWALAAAWAFCDPRPGRPAGALLLVSGVGAASMWLA